MKSKHFYQILTAAAVAAATLYIISCSDDNFDHSCTLPPTLEWMDNYSPAPATSESDPAVYFTKEINADGIMAIYEALGLKPMANDKVAIKIHSGEPGGDKNFVNPAYLSKLRESVNGTFVETNAAYSPTNRRLSTSVHLAVAKEHGYYTDATRSQFEILDESSSRDDSLTVTVSGTSRLKGKNYVGEHFKKYNFHVVVSHFKGHGLGGFGGALKNISIGYASKAGKLWIHSAGAKKTGDLMGALPQNADHFKESMAEAAKSIVDHAQGRILYINVMNNMSVDCDCMDRKAAPKIKDIGVLGSLDPVALDKACLDIIDGLRSSDGITPQAVSGSGSGTKDLLDRIQQHNGRLTVTHAASIGVGKTSYQFVNLDKPNSILEFKPEIPVAGL